MKWCVSTDTYMYEESPIFECNVAELWNLHIYPKKSCKIMSFTEAQVYSKQLDGV